MKQRFCVLLFLLTMQTAVVKTQTPQSFFPHRTGDEWVYLWVDRTPWLEWETLKVSVVFDSTGDLDGFRYVRTFERFISTPPHPGVLPTYHYTIDTLHQVFERWLDWTSPIWRRIYKLDAGAGALWTVREDSGAYSEIARIGEVYQGSVFHIPTTVKSIDYFFTEDTSDTTIWLHLYSNSIAEGFGSIYFGGGDAFYDAFLIAARIGGVAYGDTTLLTLLEEPYSNVPKEIQLHPAYPNPFNAETSIRFSLPVRTRVALTVHDLLGRHVTTLVNEEREAGEWSVRWNAHDLSSGVYLARLKGAGVFRVTKLLLTK